MMEEGSPMSMFSAAADVAMHSPPGDLVMGGSKEQQQQQQQAGGDVSSSKGKTLFFDDETMPLSSPASAVNIAAASNGSTSTTANSNALNSFQQQQQQQSNILNHSRQSSPLKEDAAAISLSTPFEQQQHQHQQQQLQPNSIKTVETTNIITCLNSSGGFNGGINGNQNGNGQNGGGTENKNQQQQQQQVKKIISKLEDMKVSDLKAELKRRNLPVSGAKQTLIERLKPFSESVVSTNNSLATNPGASADLQLNGSTELISNNSAGGGILSLPGTTTFTPIATPLNGNGPTTTFIIKNADGSDFVSNGSGSNGGGCGVNDPPAGGAPPTVGTTSMLFITSNGTVVNPIALMQQPPPLPQYQIVTTTNNTGGGDGMGSKTLGAAGGLPTFKLATGSGNGNNGSQNQAPILLTTAANSNSSKLSMLSNQPISIGTQLANRSLGTGNGNGHVTFLTTATGETIPIQLGAINKNGAQPSQPFSFSLAPQQQQQQGPLGNGSKQFISIQNPQQQQQQPNSGQVIHQLLLYPASTPLNSSSNSEIISQSSAKQRSNSVPSETFHQLQR